MEFVIQFLLKNGFTRIGEGIYMNLKCIVKIHADNYEVEFKMKDSEEMGTMYSPDINIYWLIGMLTYQNLIPRDYKLPNE